MRCLSPSSPIAQNGPASSVATSHPAVQAAADSPEPSDHPTVAARERLGGHIVQGHVDGTAEVIEAEDDGFARRLRVELDPRLGSQVIERGSIALDGVSLTVSGLGDDWLEVSLIPETLLRTNLRDAAPGRRLNVECDLIGKYVQRLMAPLRESSED